MTMEAGEPADKVCVRCHARFPLDDFAVNRRTLDGRSSWCRPCHREAAHEHHRKVYVPRPRPVSPIPGVSPARLRRCGWSWRVHCSKCDKFLWPCEFHAPSGGTPGLRAWCGECSRAMATGYNRPAGHPPRCATPA